MITLYDSAFSPFARKVRMVLAQGKVFDRAPRFSTFAALDWTPHERVRLSAQLRHRSRYYTDPPNSPDTRVGSANNVDIRGEYRFGNLRIFAQVRNLFDAVNMLDLGDADYGEAEDQRTLAIGIEGRFSP